MPYKTPKMKKRPYQMRALSGFTFNEKEAKHTADSYNKNPPVWWGGNLKAHVAIKRGKKHDRYIPLVNY